MHYYFGFLDARFPKHPSAWRALLKKTAFNQLFLNPFVYLPLFYTWTGMWYSRTLDQTLDKAKHEWWDSLVATWVIFTPLNLVNFSLVPLRHQQAVNAAASFVYNTTLSLIAAPRPSDTMNERQGGAKSESEARTSE